MEIEKVRSRLHDQDTRKQYKSHEYGFRTQSYPIYAWLRAKIRSGEAHDSVFTVKLLELLGNLQGSIWTVIVNNDHFIIVVTANWKKNLVNIWSDEKRFGWRCNLKKLRQLAKFSNSTARFSKGFCDQPDHNGKILSFLICRQQDGVLVAWFALRLPRHSPPIRLKSSGFDLLNDQKVIPRENVELPVPPDQMTPLCVNPVLCPFQFSLVRPNNSGCSPWPFGSILYSFKPQSHLWSANQQISSASI
jgi:hypothetical protein